MAIIAEHFRQKGVRKVYVFSDKQDWIKKNEELYMDAIDLEGQEVYYTETDIPLFPPEPDEPATAADYEDALERFGVTNDKN